MGQRKAVTRKLLARYKKAGKKEKRQILNEFVAVTDYNRHYAAWRLRQSWITKLKRKKRIKVFRPRVYDVEVFRELKRIWLIWDCICSKRLVPFLPEAVKKMEQFGGTKYKPELKEKLLSISPATVDRMLVSVKKGYRIKGISTTKPGTLLKQQIPVRTFTDWDDLRPGFFEIDLVAHCGETLSGEYINSLNFTDVSSGWVEPAAVMGKAQERVFAEIEKIKKNLPFPLLGIDSDNDSPFINNELFRYCLKEQITFTRCRAGKKNDQAYVEQKNYSVIRRLVGYARYDKEKQLIIIKELYQTVRLYINFFHPVMKLIKKQRIGAKVKKWYDKAQTPCQRILIDKTISQLKKQRLKKQYQQLNPIELKRKIDQQLQKLENTLKVEN